MSCCNPGEQQPYDLSKRIDPENKRILNCNHVDVNQLMPIKYHWAWSTT